MKRITCDLRSEQIGSSSPTSTGLPPELNFPRINLSCDSTYPKGDGGGWGREGCRRTVRSLDPRVPLEGGSGNVLIRIR